MTPRSWFAYRSRPSRGALPLVACCLACAAGCSEDGTAGGTGGAGTGGAVGGGGAGGEGAEGGSGAGGGGTGGQGGQAVGAGLAGVRLNAEVFNGSGTSYGEAWPRNYHDPYVQQQVVDELDAVRQVTGMNTIAHFTGTGGDFDWPTPQAVQIERLVAFINDANAAGTKVALFLGTHCIVSNSTAATYGPANRDHVGGHTAGETVNDVYLWTDMAYCEEDNITQAQAWYATILAGIDDPVDGVVDPNGIAYLALSGHPYLPFATEINLFSSADPLLPYAQQYVAAVVPALRSVTARPIGISTLPATWLAPANHFDYLDNLFDAVPIAEWDRIDVTGRMECDYGLLHGKVGADHAHRIVLSDFKVDDSALTPAQTLQAHLTAVTTYGFGGWWYWQYKDAGNGSGIREAGYFGVTGGWKPELLAVIQDGI